MSNPTAASNMEVVSKQLEQPVRSQSNDVRKTSRTSVRELLENPRDLPCGERMQAAVNRASYLLKRSTRVKQRTSDRVLKRTQISNRRRFSGIDAYEMALRDEYDDDVVPVVVEECVLKAIPARGCRRVLTVDDFAWDSMIPQDFNDLVIPPPPISEISKSKSYFTCLHEEEDALSSLLIDKLSFYEASRVTTWGDLPPVSIPPPPVQFAPSSQLNGNNGEVTGTDDMKAGARKDMPRKSALREFGNGRLANAGPPQPPLPRKVPIHERLDEIRKEFAELRSMVSAPVEKAAITAKGGGCGITAKGGGSVKLTPPVSPLFDPTSPVNPPQTECRTLSSSASDPGITLGRVVCPPSLVKSMIQKFSKSSSPSLEVEESHKSSSSMPLIVPRHIITDDHPDFRDAGEVEESEPEASIEDDEFPWSDVEDSSFQKKVLVGVCAPNHLGLWDRVRDHLHLPFTIVGSVTLGGTCAFAGQAIAYAHLGPLAPLITSSVLGVVGCVAPFCHWFLTSRWRPAYHLEEGVVELDNVGSSGEEHGDWVSHVVDSVGIPTDTFRCVNKVEERLLFDLTSLGYNSLHRMNVDSRIVDHLRLNNSAVNEHSYGAFKFQVTSSLPTVCKEMSCHLLDRSVMYAVQCVQVTQLRASHRLTGCRPGILSMDPKKLK